jgi:hypothetical protein
MLLVVGLAWLWRRSAARQPAPVRDLRAAVFVTYATLVLFLAFMTVRYNWKGLDWSYLDEQRYFRPVWAAAALFWLTLVDALTPAPRVKAVLTVVLAGAVVYLLQAHARTEYLALTVPDESWELVRQVRGLETRGGVQVVLDTDISDYIVTPGPNLLARQWPNEEDVPRLVVGRPADLWLVRRVNEVPPWGQDPERPRRQFAAVTARFPAEKAWSSSGGQYELYHAHLAPEGPAEGAP